MVRHARPLLLLIMLLSTSSVGTQSQQQTTPDDVGLSGLVVGPDGTPVSSGTVQFSGPGTLVTATIDRDGRFRLVPGTAGVPQLLIIVPGLATHRVNITVPPSRTMKLPVMQLSLPTFFRVRFVTADGEPITHPQLRRQSLDVSGMPITEPPEARASEQTDGEGTITIGPLPRGVTTMALVMPLFAQLRLPDLHVTGSEPLLDAGTITVSTGATLHVDLVDASGTPVPAHDVYLEDAVPLSPISRVRVRTSKQGRATFNRLNVGRYRVSTDAVAPCGGSGWPLPITRVVAVSGTGSLRTRIVIGGTASFRLSSVFGPLKGVSVTVSPDTNPIAYPPWVRERSNAFARMPTPFAIGPPCRGTTDDDGRVTLTTFPPGPARVEVRQLNSTYVRRVTVPENGREQVIVIPDGFLPLRVVDALKNAPISGAEVTWTGGGGRVQARTTAVGEALLEGVGTAGGTLAITASGFDPGEEKFTEPPGMLHEVALLPSPPTFIEVRVVNAAGAPVRDAVVELLPANAIEIGHIKATDAKGLVRFTDLPAGSLRFVATADGYRQATLQVAEDQRRDVVLTLSPSLSPSVVMSRANRGAHPH